MSSGFTYIVCAAPGQTRDASRFGLTLAHLSWQLGDGMRIVEGGVSSLMRGGYMVLGDALYDGGAGNPSALVDACLRECSLRMFEGVVFDFEQRTSKHLEAFVAEAGPYLHKRGLGTVVPERYAHACREAQVLVPTAMSSGSLHTRLREARERYGLRIVLEIEALRRDILLPGPQSAGTALHREELDALLAERRGVKFYSQEMCAHYFTYKDVKGSTHFVLFDDAASFRSKAQAALRLGIDRGFILYPEVESFLPALI